jgi:excisionase family DNA binding protein
MGCPRAGLTERISAKENLVKGLPIAISRRLRAQVLPDHPHQPFCLDPYRFSLVFLDRVIMLYEIAGTTTRLIIHDGEAFFLMKERWSSVEQIARHLGVNPGTIYKWIERKQMPAHRVGRLWKFLTSEVDEWVKAGKAGPAKKKSRTSLKNPRRTGHHE